MDRSDPVAGVAVLVAVVLVAAGPLTGVDATTAGPRFNDGDATVETVTVDETALEVTPGRFGSEFAYLRIPPATVTVDSVTERPRLLYIVSVPGLDVEQTASVVVTGPGTYDLDIDDVALSDGTNAGVYEATVTVRVQSFDTDRTLYRSSTSVEVSE